MGRIINGIYFENNDSSIKNSPITESIIQEQEDKRLINRIINKLSREIEIDGIQKQSIDKSIRTVVNKIAETIEKEFQKHGGTVSR